MAVYGQSATGKSVDSAGKWQFWINCGGTSTDLVAQRPDGELITHTLLSENQERSPDAAIHGIWKILEIDADDPLPTS